MDGVGVRGGDGPPGASLMGVLLCQLRRRGRRQLAEYKKRFWVLNEPHRSLMMYTNDQAHLPRRVIHVRDIRGVECSGDKQNRFFVMTVKTRRRFDIRFRMKSFFEREQWAAALQRMIEADATNNPQRWYILSQVDNRLREAARKLEVALFLDVERLITGVRQDLLQYVLEAVDGAVRTMLLLKQSLAQTLQCPRMFLLTVHTSPDEAALYGPRYDPLTRCVVLQACLYRNETGYVTFRIDRCEDIMRIISSAVFRDPFFENWIEAAGCAHVRQEMMRLLHARQMPIRVQWGPEIEDKARVQQYFRTFVNEDFFAAILRALDDTVAETERLLRGLTPIARLDNEPDGAAALIAAVSGNEKLNDTLRSPLLRSWRGAATVNAGQPGRTPHSTTTTTNNVVSVPFDRPTQHEGNAANAAANGGSMRAGRTANSHPPTSATMARQGTSFLTNMYNVGSGQDTGNGLSRRTASSTNVAATMSRVDSMAATMLQLDSDPAAVAVRFVASGIAGLALLLSRPLIDANASGPGVSVVYAGNYEQRCRPAFVVMSYYYDIYGPAPTPYNTLQEQLAGIAFHAILQSQLGALLAQLNALFERRFRIVVSWERLLRAAYGLAIPLSKLDVLHLVSTVAEVCLPYSVQLCQCVTDWAKAASEAGEPSTNEPVQASPLAALAARVQWVLFDFVAFVEGDVRTMTQPMASVANGVLSNVVFCMHEHILTLLTPEARQRTDMTFVKYTPLITTITTTTSNSNSNATLVMCACSYDFKEWLNKSGTTTTLANATADGLQNSLGQTLRLPFEDNPESESGNEEGGESDSDMHSDNLAANTRSNEIRILNLPRVVNIVYDSQVGSHTLKISADDIRSAVASLERAFRYRPITKRDLLRILVFNLQTLRRLYLTACEGRSEQLLGEAAAVQMLKDYCEYAESEAHVVALLQSGPSVLPPLSPTAAMTATTTAATTTNNYTTTAYTPTVSTNMMMTNNNTNNNTMNANAPMMTMMMTTTEAAAPGAQDPPMPDGEFVAAAAAAAAPASTASHGVTQATGHDAAVPQRLWSAPSMTEVAYGNAIPGSYASENGNAVSHHHHHHHHHHGGGVGGPLTTGTPVTMSVAATENNALRTTAANTNTTTIDAAAGNGFPPITSTTTVAAPATTSSNNNCNGQCYYQGNPTSAGGAATMTTAPATTVSQARYYSYHTLACLALNGLLPIEATLAQRAWRVGFCFGLANTGKTLLINAIRGCSGHTVPTIGLSLQVVPFDRWVFGLHELGGRESFRRNWRYYVKRIPCVHFLVFAVDACKERDFAEATKYLRQVMRHFVATPLLVIFNNYRNLPQQLSMEELEGALGLPAERARNPDRAILVCACDVSTEHAVTRTMPQPLYEKLCNLSGVLLAECDEDTAPPLPKPILASRGNHEDMSNVTDHHVATDPAPAPAAHVSMRAMQGTSNMNLKLASNMNEIEQYDEPRVVGAFASAVAPTRMFGRRLTSDLEAVMNHDTAAPLT